MARQAEGKGQERLTGHLTVSKQRVEKSQRGIVSLAVKNVKPVSVVSAV